MYSNARRVVSTLSSDMVEVSRQREASKCVIRVNDGCSATGIASMTLEATADRPTPDGTEAVNHELVARTAIILFTVVPFLGVGVAAWQAWNGVLSWIDLAAFGMLYVVTLVGVTVGYHRLFTHRSFRTHAAVRGAFAVMGSMAVEGSVISWVANHRKHHAFADREGDPHSPHVG